MTIKFGIDLNGNSVVKVRNGRNSFTVQTNGNLPITHRNGKANFDIEATKQELKGYLFYEGHGTDRQKAIFNA